MASRSIPDVIADENGSTRSPLESMSADEPDKTTLVKVAVDELIESNLNGKSGCRLNDAEMVSEDELSGADPTAVAYAEEVSDEELPGPSLADLPADTEFISEDEFPTTGKRKVSDDDGAAHARSSDDGQTVVETKRKRGDADGQNVKPSDHDSKETALANEISVGTDKKSLPELEKYWKPLRADPADFTGWTYLLQYVDQEDDIEAAREAYDAFLEHYPYCYGYWRKYADYEKRKGNMAKCEEVFDRGLNAIPLSVDLWLHYLAYVKQKHGADDGQIRTQFQRAIDKCGLEFRSDKLWEAFIKWETEAKRWSRVVVVYDALLATPTQGYNGHFDNFQDIVNNHPAPVLVSTEEFQHIRAEVRGTKNATNDDSEETADKEACPTADGHSATADCDDGDLGVRDDDEMQAIRDKIIAARRRVHKHTVQAVTDRWTFEEGIKRPYFHVKPLERCQLKNWKDYLDFEIEAGDHRRVMVLFERCLIACALYDDFWLKLVRYLESKRNAADDPTSAAAFTEQIRSVFERACIIHHPDKPALHMLWASFEESYDNADRAAQILKDLDASSPNLLQIAYRRCNLERRRGDYALVSELFESYIINARTQAAETGKHKSNESSLAIKYARFLHRIRGDFDAALGVLRDALGRDRYNTRLALQFIDLALQRTPSVCEAEIVAVIDSFVDADADDVDLDQRVLFAQRKVEFLDDFGESALELQEAQRSLQVVMSRANEAKKNKSEVSPSKSKANSTAASATADASAQYAYAGSSSSSNAYYGQQAYSGGATQPYSDGYNYNQQWQQYGGSGSNYAGTYSQWSGYHNSSAGGNSGYY